MLPWAVCQSSETALTHTIAQIKMRELSVPFDLQACITSQESSAGVFKQKGLKIVCFLFLVYVYSNDAQ